MAEYNKGEVFKSEGYCINEGYVWRYYHNFYGEKRYIATTEVTNAGMFRLENGKMVKLSVCKPCYDRIRSSKYGSATNFKYADFSKDRFITPKVGFRKGRLDPRITRF